MARRSKKTMSVALFPFLAVLVCTMGSLIFLLLVTTRQIRVRAIAQAVSESPNVTPAPPISAPAPMLLKPRIISMSPDERESESDLQQRKQSRADHSAKLKARERELEDLLAEWNQRAGQLEKLRDDHACNLNQRQPLTEAAEQRTTALKDELDKWERQLASLAGELSSLKGDATVRERQTLEQQISLVKKRLKQAQIAQATEIHNVAVVPFDPQSGTSRRPILIECTADGIRFVPENIVLKAEDLEGFTPRVNPLLAGTNSLVRYWTQWNLKQPKPTNEPEPYVLILVRPSGTITYYIAMRMLETLQQPHGYELIEAETTLQEPIVDPAARTTCEAAVKQLLAERDSIQAFAAGSVPGGGGRRLGGRGEAFRGNDSATAGGQKTKRFDVTDITGEGDEVGSRSWERIDKFRRGTSRHKKTTDIPGDSVAATESSPLETLRQEFSDEPAQGGSQADQDRQPVGGDEQPVRQRNPLSKPTRTASKTKEFLPEADTAPPADDGIESLQIAEAVESTAANSGDNKTSRNTAATDIGLGSTGTPSIAVEDLRTKPRSTRSKPADPEHLRRKHWGLSAPDAVIGLEREVRIKVEANRLVVSDKHAIHIAPGESNQQTFERLIVVLDLQAREWGQPPRGFYWTPNLCFVVVKEGNSNFEGLHAITKRAGLGSSKEYATDGKIKYATPSAATRSNGPLATRGGTP